MKRRMTTVTIFALVLLIFGATASAQCRGISRAVKRASRIADDIPLRNLDNFVPDRNISRMTRDALGEGKHLDDVAYTRKLARELNEVGRNLDPQTVRTLQKMDGPTREMVVLVGRGAKNVGDMPLDVMRRADFMKAVDGKTLCALGMDKTLVRDALNMQDLLKMGKIPSPKGLRAVTLDDFGAFFHKYGAKGADFWKTTIRPHWKAWAVGGALAAILLTPEEYLDEAGELLHDAGEKLAKYGVKLVTALAGGLAEGTVEGTGEVVAEGVGNIVEKTGEATQKTLVRVKNFFTTSKGLCALLTFFLIACCLFSGFRKLVKGLFKAIFNVYRRLVPRKKLGKDIE